MNVVVFREANRMEIAKVSQRATVVIADDWELRGERNLFVGASATAQRELVEAGFRLLARWDVAVPFHGDGILADSLGGPEERARTAAVCGDLRQPVYAHELLFVRDTEPARELIATWRREADGADERLAFLRALHLVKPLLYALPGLWLQKAIPVPQRRRMAPEIETVKQAAESPDDLVRVEIGKRRYVQCRRSEVAMIRERYRVNNMSREERVTMAQRSLEIEP